MICPENGDRDTWEVPAISPQGESCGTKELGLSGFVVNVPKGLCTSVGLTSVFTSSYCRVSSYYSVTSEGFGDDLVILFSAYCQKNNVLKAWVENLFIQLRSAGLLALLSFLWSLAAAGQAGDPRGQGLGQVSLLLGTIAVS